MGNDRAGHYKERFKYICGVAYIDARAVGPALVKGLACCFYLH